MCVQNADQVHCLQMQANHCWKHRRSKCGCLHCILELYHKELVWLAPIGRAKLAEALGKLNGENEGKEDAPWFGKFCWQCCCFASVLANMTVTSPLRIEVDLHQISDGGPVKQQVEAWVHFWHCALWHVLCCLVFANKLQRTLHHG